MRSTALTLLALLAAGTIHAETTAPVAGAEPAAMSPATPTAAPTAVPVFISNPPVTPDATFVDASYASKWPHISLEEAKRLAKDKHNLFVDGRSKLEWDQSHMPGALPMPLGEFDKYFAQYEKKLRKAKVLMAYCHGKGCHLSDGLAQRLVDKGLKNVAVYWGGYPEWHDNHQPLVDKAGKSVAEPTPVPVATPAK